ncbi:bifunctional UDP-sugar hydrolase/5'-nucleotidase [Porphyromonas sp.]|uniref:bifunctional metallophosphatase/5'-nucleotidase n=1 Tax=Porphyromonas sp. TaxID=1924944 RepID=UPI0026DC1A17|nr:bifunctional UDP-sugar hydrolase/5'-nucleotidase [Porphyromonas sp.]MDO4771131.1 bifunctional UDP-sugar hydrolase/5'-nucleotidase [Porphyromonas sp.]
MNFRFRHILWALTFVTLFVSCQSRSKTGVVIVDIFHTTDLHGNVFPHDFINDVEGKGSYARIASYVKAYRQSSGNMLLLDAGDILQGQPTAYYYNFIDTSSKHLMAEVLNQLDYNAITVGNHDIETGHDVYDRWVKELSAPVLGANVIDVARSEGQETPVPYFVPYTMITKAGKKFAILGLTTPAVPNFLPEVLWSGMRFDDIVETARRYMPEIQAAQPDYIIALVHSGIGEKTDSVRYLAEDAGYALASQVAGIDLVLLGHDHRSYVDSVVHESGRKTYILNPANNGHNLSRTTVTFKTDADGNNIVESTPSIINLDKYIPDGKFIKDLTPQYNTVRRFVAERIGATTADISSRSSFMGPSTFVDLVHQVQLSLFEDADMSLSAPLIFDTKITTGDITMSDLFKLYKFENMAYLMRLTGQEIKDLLEESYDRWILTMKSADDKLLRLSTAPDAGFKFEKPFFNFDSACGVMYTVDVTKPKGERIKLTTLRDGRTFDPSAEYKVVVNSYRGNGGGALLTEGSGIPHSELTSRIVRATEKDLRYYLMEYLKIHNPITPQIISQWSFEPAEWTRPALKRDSVLLFKAQ